MGVDENIAVIQSEMRRQLMVVKRIEQKTEISELEKIKVGEVYKFQRNVNELIKAFKAEKNAAFGRMPPHAEDLEQAILGGLILESMPTVRDGQKRPSHLEAVKKYLKSEHFYRESHKLIYSALVECKDNQGDLVSLNQKLRQNGHIEIIGGAAYLVELTNKVSSTANIEYNSRVLIEFAIKRRLIMLGSLLINSGYDDMQDALELFEQARAELIQIQEWTTK